MAVPKAPVIRAPAKGAYTNTSTGTDVNVSGTWSSEHANDQLMALEVVILSSTATDAVPGTPIQRRVPKRGDSTDAWSLGSAKWSGRIAGLAHHTTYKVRARCKGHLGWGPWSSLTGQTFITNARAGVTTFAWTAGTLTPTFSARIKTADPSDSISGIQVQVMEDYSANLTVTRWDSGKVLVGGTPNTATVTYAGEALVWGGNYRARVLLWDASGQESTWSAWTALPIVQNAGPTVTPSDTVTRLSATPTWTIARAAAFDGYQLQAFATDDMSGSPVYDSGTVAVTSSTSENHTAASALPSGSFPFIRARVRTTGQPDLGVWSASVPNYIAAAPTSPSAVTPGSYDSTDPAYVTTTPTLSAVYEHPDRDTYGDVPSRREVELWNATLSSMLQSSYVDSPTYTVPMVWSPSTLTAETTYAQRWRFKDALANFGPWSAWVYLRAVVPPTATRTAPGASTTDPTPALSWTYYSAGSHAQAMYQAVLYDSTGADLFDTGIVVGTETTVTVPSGTLNTASTYYWYVTVWDDIGQSGTSSVGSFTTSFSTPATPTGFNGTPNASTSSVALAWSASGLSDAEFVHWAIYRQDTTDAGFVLVTTIATKATLAYTDYGCPLGVAVTYKLVQYNGWAESAGATTVETLPAVVARSWQLVVGGDARLTIEFAQGTVTGAPSDMSAPSETYRVLGRTIPITETGILGGYSGSLSILLRAATLYLEGRILEIQRSNQSAWLKDAYGNSTLVRITGLRREPGPVGRVAITVDWIQVD
jgi:hypothetical protein